MAFFGDVQELILEKPCSIQKSPEELDRLTVDEQLKPIERAVYLLSSGQEVQRVSVVNSLPELLRDHQADCMRRIVPKVREIVRVADAEMQLAACDIFYQILKSSLVPLAVYSDTFLQTVLMCIDAKDADLAGAWLTTLLRIIELLPKEVISCKILSKAVAKGQLHQSVQSRLACCQMLGTIVTKFDAATIRRDILPTVFSLCQDVDHEVRACMAHLLDPVARGLGAEDTKAAILRELVELSADEQSHVRHAALDAVVSIISMLDNDAVVSTVIPLVCRFCQDAFQQQDVAMLIAVAQHFGRLYEGVVTCLSEEQKKSFIEFYKKLCRLGTAPYLTKKASQPEKEKYEMRGAPRTLPPIVSAVVEEPDQSEHSEEYDEVRRCAAYSFPAMAQLLGPKIFKAELTACCTQLCNDRNVGVRRTIAAGIHEIARVLGNSSNWIVMDVIQLLSDNSMEVLSSGFLAHLPDTLEMMCRGNKTTTSQSKLYDVLCAIITCGAVIFTSNNWRLQQEYVEMLGQLPRCYSPNLINMKVIPHVRRKMSKARALPVRRAAVRTLLLLVRANCLAEQRADHCTSLVTDYAAADSFHKRSLFIDVCQISLDIYSRAFFKQYFCEALLRLHADRVPNVRLRLCAMLPRVKHTMRQPADSNLAQMLEACVRSRLANERDRDVLDVLRQSITELDQIPIELESSQTRRTEDDREDQRRMDEERRLLEAEDKERKQATSPTKSSSLSSADKIKRLPGVADAKAPPNAVVKKRSVVGTATSASVGAAAQSASVLPLRQRVSVTHDMSSLTNVPRVPATSAQSGNSNNTAGTGTTTPSRKKAATLSLSSGAVVAPNNNSLSPSSSLSSATPQGTTATRSAQSGRVGVASPLPEVRRTSVHRMSFH